MTSCIRQASLGLAFLAVLFTGCNSKKVLKVHGKLLKNGQAMVVSEDTYVTLSFVVPAGTTSVDLEVGRPGVQETAKIPITLGTVKP